MAEIPPKLKLRTFLLESQRRGACPGEVCECFPPYSGPFCEFEEPWSAVAAPKGVVTESVKALAGTFHIDQA